MAGKKYSLLPASWSSPSTTTTATNTLTATSTATAASDSRRGSIGGDSNTTFRSIRGNTGSTRDVDVGSTPGIDGSRGFTTGSVVRLPTSTTPGSNISTINGVEPLSTKDSTASSFVSNFAINQTAHRPSSSRSSLWASYLGPLLIRLRLRTTLVTLLAAAVVIAIYVAAWINKPCHCTPPQSVNDVYTQNFGPSDGKGKGKLDTLREKHSQRLLDATARGIDLKKHDHNSTSKEFEPVFRQKRVTKTSSNFTERMRELSFKHVGCAQVLPSKFMLAVQRSDAMTAEWCANYCYFNGGPYFGLTGGNQCGCLRSFDANPLFSNVERCFMACSGDTEATDILCGGRVWWASICMITTPIPEVITMYVAPAKRTSSLFTTGRFKKYLSGHYLYVKKPLNHLITRTEEMFYEEVCVRNPGKKIFVQIAGAIDFLLINFPENSVLVLTGDEVGNWGITNKGRAIGPHGAGKPFDSSESGHILLPPSALPFFKQYYNENQWRAWPPGDVRFVPLGSRNEFPDIDSKKLKRSSHRDYIYAYMVALTDNTRQQLHTILVKDTIIPTTQRFIHVTQNWHGNANHEDYVDPQKYAQIMLDSIFVLCPKGHHIEQFRIYEALEAGALPVLARDDGYLNSHIPPEYLQSPMIFVDRWQDAPAMLAKLVSDRTQLDIRQKAMQNWYDAFMTSKMREIETVLEEKANQTAGFCTQYQSLK